MPLTAKGAEIKSSMQETYGAEKGERVFYASRNAGTISGVDSAKLDAACAMMDAAQPSKAWRAVMQNKDNMKSYEVAGANAKETYQLRKKIEEAERAGNATRMAELRAVYAHVEAVGKAAHESRPVNSTRAFGSRLDEACSKMDALTK